MTQQQQDDIYIGGYDETKGGSRECQTRCHGCVLTPLQGNDHREDCPYRKGSRSRYYPVDCVVLFFGIQVFMKNSCLGTYVHIRSIGTLIPCILLLITYSIYPKEQSILRFYLHEFSTFVLFSILFPSYGALHDPRFRAFGDLTRCNMTWKATVI